MLISIYNKYKQWLGNDKYDEMDIVRKALAHSKFNNAIIQSGFEDLIKLSPEKANAAVEHLNMSNEAVFHKQDARKALSSGKFTKSMEKAYLSFKKKMDTRKSSFSSFDCCAQRN